MKGGPILLAALLTSFTASLCCILPIAVAVFGIGSISLATAIGHFRMPLSLLTLGILGFALYLGYRPESGGCRHDGACATSAGRRRTRILLWIATFVALALLAFPYYSWFLV